MKLRLILPLVAMLAFAACKNDKQNAAPSAKSGGSAHFNDDFKNQTIDLNKSLFDAAMKMGDLRTAVLAANTILQLDSSSKTQMYLDTLATLYMAGRIDKAANAVADKLLARNKENKSALEVKISHYLMTGNGPEAINIARRLYGKYNAVKYLFQIVNIQLESRQVPEATATLKEIEAKSGYEKDSVPFTSENGDMNQNVPAKAAVSYIRGVMALSTNPPNVQEGVAKLQDALKIYPDFENAKAYMMRVRQALAQQQQQQGAPK